MCKFIAFKMQVYRIVPSFDAVNYLVPNTRRVSWSQWGLPEDAWTLLWWVEVPTDETCAHWDGSGTGGRFDWVLGFPGRRSERWPCGRRPPIRRRVLTRGRRRGRRPGTVWTSATSCSLVADRPETSLYNQTSGDSKKRSDLVLRSRGLSQQQRSSCSD